MKPSADAFKRMSDAFEGVPAFLGPLYVDDGDGELVVFGFGWPSNASKLVAETVHVDGSYITED